MQKIVVLVCGLLFCLGFSTSAITFYVAPDGNDAANGLSWATAKQTIQAAVDVAVTSGDLVLVTNGTYASGGMELPFADRYSTNRVCVTNDITVQSVNGPEVTIIAGAPDTVGGSASNGPAAVRGVFLADGSALIGFTVTNGYTTTGAGGDKYAGGVYCESDTVVVSNCVISGNRAVYWAGGVYRGVLYNCTVSGNTAGNNGGGARNSELYDCYIEDNTSGNNGGGFENGFAVRSYVRDNSAVNGGGVANGSCTNCVIAGNMAVEGGGAYDATLYGCTIVGNLADEGGGIDQCEMQRSISYHNESSGLTDNYSINCTVLYSCTEPEIVSGTARSIYVSPRLSGINNPHLLAGSPCLNKGPSYGVYDIDGEPRTNGPTADWGCDERWAAAITGALTAEIEIPLGTNVVEGYALGFEAYTEGRADSLLWSFDDGEALTNEVLCRHVFTNAGNHTVTLRLTNGSHSVVATAVVHVVDRSNGTWYVAPDGSDAAAGTSWDTAKQTIQAAVDAATNYPGEVVLVSNGVYNTGGAVAPGQALTNRVCITSDIIVRSVNGPDVTFIEGAAGSNGSNDVDSVRGVYLVRGSELSGFTVHNGYTAASGEDSYGGGVFAVGNDALVTNCVISACVADALGGGGYHGTYNNCTLTGNRSYDYGGGGYEVTLNECLVSSNTAAAGGGFMIGSADRCLFVGNRAHNGGAAYAFHSSYTLLHNSLLVSNVANAGGGAYGGNYLCTLYNCTVVGNSATNSSGGGTYQCNLYNSIVYHNTAVSNEQDVVFDSHNGKIYNCCASDGIINGFFNCITNNPQFVDWQNSDYRLLMESPCVDTGDNFDAPTNITPYDIQGYSRIISTNVDMGAYETPLATVGPTNGPLGGGNLVVMTNVAPAISGITNVLVGDLSAVDVIEQGTNWVAFRPPRGMGSGTPLNLTLQSSTADDLVFVSAYTYDAAPAQVYVDANNGDDENSGQSWVRALQTIQSAVDLVATGGVITVTNGVYDSGASVTPGYTASNRVTITKALTLQSVNGPVVTKIVGAPGSNGSNDVDSIRGVYAYVDSGAALISGFMITNGYSCSSGNSHRDKSAGGVFIGKGCTISNCVITGNKAVTQGGGVYLYNGDAVQNCLVAMNQTLLGGGGVGIFTGGEVNNCIIRDNIALGSPGGGVYMNSMGTVNNCLVVSNTADSAGGIYTIYDDNEVNNSSIIGNTAISGTGGGINITDNSTLNNCIVWSNSAATYEDINSGTGGVVRYTCASQNIGSPGWTGSVGCLTNVNPMFVSPETDDYSLQELSPCVNVGNNTYAPTNTVSTDLEGNDRIFDVVVDMGAYELQKKQQTITFNPIAEQTYGDTLNPGATASSTLNVTYTSGDTAVCTNNGPRLYFVGTGTCNIVASQTGTLEWAQAPNVTQSLTVAAASLSITGAVVQNKTYDGNRSATVSGAGLSGVISGDDVTLIGGTTGTFAQATVGTNLAVTMAMSLGGTDAQYYETPGQPSLHADITAKGLTVTGAVAANKTYDGTKSATVSGAGLSGVVGSDAVLLAHATTGTFQYAIVNTGVVVDTYMTIGGADAGNYALTNQPSLKADITGKELTVTGAVVQTKVYNKSTGATIVGAGLSGVIGGDTVTLVNATSGVFAQAQVGTNISVSTAMSIDGAQAPNYTLTEPTLTGMILPKSVLVTNATASNKEYDGTPSATISGAALSGLLPLDNVTLQNASTGTFDQVDVGTNIQVTTYMTLGGTACTNYLLGGQPSLDADITAKGLVVTGAVAANKEYDGTDAATVSGAALSGVISGDTVSLDNASTGTFTQADIGSGIGVTSYMRISGAHAGNYALTNQPSLQADITAKGLVVTGAVAASKTYDGTVAASISGAGLSGVVGGDTVTLGNATTGTFTSANAAADISVQSYMTLGGDDAGNYSLNQPSLSADINKANQAITFDPISDTAWSNTVGLSASSDSGLEVSFRVVSGAATLAETNASFYGVGPVKIAASQTGNGNYNAAPSKTNSFNVTGPEFRLLGTNDLALTNNAAPSLEAGSNFGAMTAGSGALTNTFSITNSGTSVLTISGVTTSGVSRDLFVAAGVPETLAVGAVGTFTVAFEADSGGVKSAALNIVNNGPGSPFVINLRGAGSGGGIGMNTNALSYSGIYAGTNPLSQTLVLTNTGISVFTYTNAFNYSSGAGGWLTVQPTGAVVAAGAIHALTNSINLSGVGAGMHTCTVGVYAADATNSPQSYVVTLDVARADQTIIFDSPGAQLTTNHVGLSATSDSGLTVSFAVGSGAADIDGGTNLTFRGAGTVSILASQSGDANYNAADVLTNTITVTKAVASVSLTNLVQTYNGSERIVGAVTSPTGLTVNITYNGSTTAPTNADSYTVVGTVNDDMYQGAKTNTLVVSKANQSIMFLPIPEQATTNTVGLRATATSGGTVSFGLLSGPGAIAGGTNLSFTGAGTVEITASQGGDGNYNVAPVITNSILITRSYQRDLGFAPSTYMDYMSTNALTTTGGSGTGAVLYSVSSGPGAITNSTGLFIQSGTGVISVVATKAADAMYNATAATATIYCARADQSITFPEVGIQLVSNVVALSASASSGLTVQYGVTNGPGSLMGSNLTCYATGTVYVTAAQAGNSNWSAAVTVTQQVIVLDTPPVGSIRCTISPEGVRDLGCWRVDEGTWKKSGVLVTNLSPGTYDVDFKDAVGWISPDATNVSVSYAQTTVVTGMYTMRKSPNDFDHDGISDIGCYYPTDGYWYVYKSKEGALWVTNYAGGEGTVPVTGDFDGDDTCDYGTYYAPNGLWKIMESTAGEWINNFGFEGTVPVTGDLDGDGILDFGCYYDQEGWWYIYKSSTGFWNIRFGYSGTVPITGDFDGDGIDDFGCYYAPDGWWYIFKSASSELWTMQFGYGGTVPVTGDFDGDGIDDFGCYYAPDGYWYLQKSREGFQTAKFGYEGTVPITGDYDGDGITDFGCYHAPDGYWYVYMSATQKLWVNQFGFTGTIPLK